MKSAIRGFFFGAAGVGLLLGLFVWDALRRSEAAIDADERRVAGEIAALRAKHARWIPSKSPWPLYAEALAGGVPRIYGNLTWPAAWILRLGDRNRAGIFFPYEDGGHQESKFVALLTMEIAMDNSHLRPAWSIEEILVSLALPQDLHRAGGVGEAIGRQDFEMKVIREWQHLLRDSTLTSDELEESAAIMDCLERNRPDISDALAAERAMNRLQVLRVLQTRSDDRQLLEAGPSWRSLTLWRVFIAQTLASIDRFYRAMGEVETVSIQDRAERARSIYDDLESRGLLPPVRFWLKTIAYLYAREARVLRQWAFMRMATALAWYDAEHGSVPATLDELVPRYIPRLPDWPRLETPIPSEHLIHVSTWAEPNEEPWVVRRQ